MISVETDSPQPSPGRNSAIESFIFWRNKLEEMRRSKVWNGMAIMHWLNHMGQFRDELAPWEWIWCPECGGRGMWVDGGNHWCPRCSGTRILVARELTDPAEIALVRRMAPPPDWGRLYSRAELGLVPELKVEGEQ